MLAYNITASVVWLFVSVALWLITAAILLGFLWTFQKPIFGNKSISYGRCSKYCEIYPLFGEQKRLKKHRIPLKKRLIISGAVLGCVMLSMITGYLGLHGRYELTSTSVTKYNAFNNITKQYALNEVTSYTIKVYYRTDFRTFGGSYDLRLTLKMTDGKNLDFENFKDVYAMQEADAALKGSAKNVESIEHLEDYINDHSYSEQEIGFIYELFETNEAD
jgi:hypothetical protein